MAILFLVLYLNKYRSIPVLYSAFIFSAYGLGSLFAGPLGGWLCDKYTPSRVCVFSLLTSGIIMIALPLSPTWLLISITFTWGLIGECYRPAVQVMLAHFCNPSQRKTAYSLNRLALNLGMTLAPLCGSILLVNRLYNDLFYIDGLTSIVSAYFIYIFLNSYFKNYPSTKTNQTSIFTSFKIVLLDHRMVYLTIAMTLALSIFFQQSSTLPLFLVDRLNLGTNIYGYICALNTVIIILFELPISINTSYLKPRSLLPLSALFLASGFGLYYFAKGLSLIIFGVFIWTSGEMILFPCISSYIFDIAPLEYRGAYMGFYSMGVNIAFIVGPLLGTWVYRVNANTLWGLCFLTGILSALLFYNQANYEKMV